MKLLRADTDLTSLSMNEMSEDREIVQKVVIEQSLGIVNF
jgi:hypothetical protein